MNQTLLIWALILIAGIGTFSLRLSFIAFLEKIKEPPWFSRALKYIPAAVMAALVSSSLLLRENQLALSLENHRLLAGVIAGAVGFFTRSLLWTILTGLIALFALTQWI